MPIREKLLKKVNGLFDVHDGRITNGLLSGNGFLQKKICACLSAIRLVCIQANEPSNHQGSHGASGAQQESGKGKSGKGEREKRRLALGKTEGQKEKAERWLTDSQLFALLAG